MARTHLDILTYNIEGLGWPARTARKPSLDEIGRRLGALRNAGQSPDVVLFQEMFSGAAVTAVERADYPSLVAGPSHSARRTLPAAGATPGRPQVRKGEVRFRLATGGLAIASVYPIVARADEPFNRRGCAGLDCLSNKGALYAQIVVPGVPVPVDLFDTHMNSRKASKASITRTTAAHAIQTAELAAFIDAHADPRRPKVLGGDFNMRGSEVRWEGFDALLPMKVVQRHCIDPRTGCQVETSWDGDAPWMDTQDLQLFEDGSVVSIRPVRVQTMFDGRPDSPKLSDHDGFRVVYELSWRMADKSSPPHGPCSGQAGSDA